MTYRLTDLSEGTSGTISKIGEIGVLRDGLYDLIYSSGNQITVNKRNEQRGHIVVSFPRLKLSLRWQEADAIQVNVFQ